MGRVIIFNGEHKCSKCNKLFKWHDHYLKGSVMVTLPIPVNAHKITKLPNNDFEIELSCEHCGKTDFIKSSEEEVNVEELK